MDPVNLFISHALTNDDIAGVRTAGRKYCEQDIQVVAHSLSTSDLYFYLPSKVCEIILALLQNEIQQSKIRQNENIQEKIQWECKLGATMEIVRFEWFWKEITLHK